MRYIQRQALGEQAKADTTGMQRSSRRLPDQEADLKDRPYAPSRRRGPLSIGVSLLIWAVMAALAWGVVALVLRWL